MGKQWVAAMVAVLVAALTAAGCGSGDDNGDTAVSGDAAAAQQEGGGDTGDSSAESEIKAVYAEMSDAYFSDDPKAFCGVLTKSAQRELASVAEKPMTCVEYVTSLIKANQTGLPGDAKPSIVRLKVKGDRALAVVKTPRSLGYPVEFVKVDGTWKVNDTGEGR